MSNPWDCPDCGSDRPGNHKRDCPGFARILAARKAEQPGADHGISPQPSERAQQMLVHATVAARGEANHHAIRELREKVEALEKRCDALASQDVLNFGHLTERLDAALKPIEELELSTTPQRAVDTERRFVELERINAALLDRVNQLVEFHGIVPIEVKP